MSHVKTRQSSCQQSWWATVVRGNEYSTVIGKKKKAFFFLATPREIGEGNGTPLQYSCLENLMNCSPPGSSVHEILQARILEWVALPSSRGSSQPKDQTLISCVSCIAGRFFIAEPLGTASVQKLI